VATVEGGLVCLEVISPQECNSQMGGLAYDIIDIKNYLSEVYSLFNKLYKELWLGFYLVNNFSNHFPPIQ